MNKIFFLAKKEWSTYFKSPIAYIVLVLTLSIFNVVFYMIIEQNREVSLEDVFQMMEFMFVFLVPLLTMILSMFFFMYWSGNGDITQGAKDLELRIDGIQITIVFRLIHINYCKGISCVAVV